MVGIEGRKLEEQGRKKESGSMNGLKHKHDPKKEGNLLLRSHDPSIP